MSAWCTRHDGGRKFVTCWLAWLLIHTSQFLFSPGWICLNYGEINCPWNGGSVVQDSHGNTNVSPPPHLASRVCCCFPGSWVLLSGGREKIKGMHSCPSMGHSLFFSSWSNAESYSWLVILLFAVVYLLLSLYAAAYDSFSRIFYKMK